MNKKDHIIYFIYWDNIDRKSYLYGADLTIHKDKSVHFRNELMPAGSVIQEWDSMETDTVIRKEPELPLLVEGRHYRIRVFAFADQQKTVILRLNFFDRQHNLVDYVMVDESDIEIECPKGAYRYSLQLINAGMGEFDFNCIVISSSEENEEPLCGRLLNRNGKGVVLSVVVPPYMRRMVRLPREQNIAGIQNCVIAPVNILMQKPFYDREWIRDLPMPDGGEVWRSINFISYNRETDPFVKELSTMYRGGFPICLENEWELARTKLR